MDTMIAEIRELERRDMALDAEKEWIRKRRREILELNKGTRKSSHDTLSPEAGKAQFADVKRKAHERSKAR
ncbi:hypothetical protein WCP94_004330 [Bilophila wadsworthia]|jgi:hypothetical protein|uniref:hypothetical protein n=1 Tax=Bilophila wadsworthia TaxID=35833 RepID=UPI0022E1C424